MKREILHEKLLTLTCAMSLAAYLAFSAGIRYWLSSWEYFRALYLGLKSQSDPISVQLWKRMFWGVTWDFHSLCLLAMLLVISFAIAWLAWLLLRGEVGFFQSIALFVPACMMFPQTILAFIFWPDGMGYITAANHMAILVLLAFGMIIYWLIWGRSRSQTGYLDKCGGSIGVWGLAFLIPAGIIVVTAFIASFGNNPGYDSLAYHMPLAVSYGISGSLATTSDITSNYPGNGELVLRWLIFPGNDRLGAISSFAALLLIAGILYKLCRALEFERQPALIAACAMLTFPVLPHLTMTPNPDLIGIAEMLTALLILVKLWRNNRASHISLGCLGIALGCGIGSRLSLLPAFAIIIIAVIVIINRINRTHLDSREGAKSNRRLIYALLSIALGALIGGGFWFVRNMVTQGNPLYPIGFMGLPGMPLDAISPVVGIMKDKPWLIFTYPWTEVGYTYIYDTGLGAVFTAIIIPSLIWWPISIIRNWKNEKGKLGSKRILVFLCIICCGLYFLSRPSVYTRHAAFAISLSFFLIAEMWRRYRGFLFRSVVFLSFLVMCFSIEKSLAGSILYRLAIPAKQGAERYGLPAAIDNLPPSRIFNAAAAFLNYGCMGVDFRHKVETLFSIATPKDVLQSKADYLVIYENQKPKFENKLRLELVSTAIAANFGDSISLYRILSSAP
jgi:hypothetical protein